jgi:hypothetical protein
MKILRILRDDVIDGNAGSEVIMEPVVEAPAEPTPEQQEMAALKEENARLKAQPVQTHQPAAAPSQITSSTLESYTDEQWATIESRTGKDKATILRDYKDYELTTRQNNIDAKTNTTEALQDAIESNPKLIKLRGSIKEFMDDVPVADKLDPSKLKRHMEKAIIYAKGKHMSITPESPASRKTSSDPSPNSSDIDGPDDGIAEGEIKNDDYVSNTGLHIKLGKVDKSVWKTIQSKKESNSVSIPIDFDKPPVFK